MVEISKMSRYAIPLIQSIKDLIPPEKEDPEEPKQIDTALGLKKTIYDEDQRNENTNTFNGNPDLELELEDDESDQEQDEEIKYESVSEDVTEPEDGDRVLQEDDSVDGQLDEYLDWANNYEENIEEFR